MTRWIVAALFLLFFAAPAAAHTRSQSYSSWSIDGDAAVFIFEVDALRVTQLSPLYNEASDINALLAIHLRETVTVRQGQAACTLGELTPFGDGRTTIRIKGRFSCPAPIEKAPAHVAITAFEAVSPTHIHIARTEFEGEAKGRLLREGAASFELNAEKPPAGIIGFLRAGFSHVLSGLDHLVFLGALILLTASRRTTLWCITGFTLGHSVSLALASLGLIHPNERLIEALIGYTIAATALEAGARFGLDRQRAMIGLALLALTVVMAPIGVNAPVLGVGAGLSAYAVFMAFMPGAYMQKLAPLIATAFGLVHGAGFARGLIELGFQRSEIVAPLVGFNLGVEAAQLTALVAIYAAAALLRRFASAHATAMGRFASALIFMLGCFWFAGRIWA
ncbi:HupE/UreJ family protein [Hyphococcus sp.]|uniref:HupE/UreJ family protein n=1 Tax=Hyphococcus sp. TaxID=2038636 RepID=UPI002083BCDD|nr:MAG: hypothetical protein DHS20C04_18060 [Marinicaulis sp.]